MPGMQKTAACVALVVLLSGCGGDAASTTGGSSASSSVAKPPPPPSSSVAAKPTASVAAPPAKQVFAPPLEDPKLDAIPDAPVQGAIRGEPFEGVLQVFYTVANKKLELSYRDALEATRACDDRDYQHKIRLELAKDTYEVGKPKTGALGVKNPDIAVGKIFASYGTGGEKGYWSSPGLNEIAYALDIQSFEPPVDAKTPGKMKVRIAVRVAGEQPTWFTGTFDGSVCAR